MNYSLMMIFSKILLWNETPMYQLLFNIELKICMKINFELIQLFFNDCDIFQVNVSVKL